MNVRDGRCGAEVRLFVSMALVGLSIVCSGRTVYVWDPEGSGGWQSAQQYFAEDGETRATTPPTVDDVVKVTTATTVGVSTDADASFVSGLAAVQLVHPDAVFEFRQPSDIQWSCALTDYGKVVKKTTATVELMDIPDKDILKLSQSNITSYYLEKGFVVEKGQLLAPQTPGKYYEFGPIAVSNEAAFVVPLTKNVYVQGLFGDGLVTNLQDYASASGGTLCLSERVARVKPAAPGVFHGKICGNFRLVVESFTQDFYGVSNTVRVGGTHYSYNMIKTATAGFLSLGEEINTPSSFGLYYMCRLFAGGHVVYLGTGEKTAKAFQVDAYSKPAIFDGGANGLLDIAGGISMTAYPDHEAFRGMGRIVFTGTNALGASVMSGKLTPNQKKDMGNGVTNYFTCYLAKEGTGAWRFKNAENDARGAWAIRDGTLQFDSLAEKGQPCSLGLSDLLYGDIYVGYGNMPDDSKKVDYAFLLGSDGNYPTLEYTGGAVASCSTRPLALTGQGGRLSSVGSGVLLFAGISAFDDGEKVLTLGGDSCGAGGQENVVSNISAGAGSVSVAKDGAGTWTLRGSNVISGTLDVKAGTLQIKDRYTSPNYTYYRMRIRGGGAYGNYCFGKIALYDEAGSNRVAGIQHRFPDDYDNLPDYYSPVTVGELAPGEFYFGDVSGTGQVKKKNGNGVFTVNGNLGWNLIDIAVQNRPSGSDPCFVMRLPDGTPGITHFDFAPYSYSAVNKIALDASVDGVEWISLTGDISPSSAVDGTHWFTGDLYGDREGTAEGYRAGQPLRPLATFDHPAYVLETHDVSHDVGDEGAATIMDGIVSVKVAANATLRALGAAKTLPGLPIDYAAAAVGTIEGFEFAVDGMVSFVNVPANAREFTLACDLSGISEENLARMQHWNVSINGRIARGVMIKVTSAGFTVCPRGLRIIVR